MSTAALSKSGIQRGDRPGARLGHHLLRCDGPGASRRARRAAGTGWVLDRVGRALGARDGTGPDDTPWLRAHHERGRNRGRVEGRAEIIDAVRRKFLASRWLSGVSDEEIVGALLECEDQTDFWARLESPRC